MNVLVIEDTGFVRTMISDILTRGNHTVVGEARDGQEGFALYKRLKPDVVITDLLMPGWDDFETLRQLKRIDPAVQVIVCSAISSKENVIRAVTLGAADFIAKPFRDEWILEALEKIELNLLHASPR